MTSLRLLFLFTVLYACPAFPDDIANLLPEGPRSLMTVSVHFNRLFVSVQTHRDLPALYLTREWPDGTPSLLRHALPRRPVSDWVVVRGETRPSVKFGLWQTDEWLGDTPRLAAPRIRRAPDGTQVYRLPALTDFFSLVERAEHGAGRLDIGLVVQRRRPADWNASTKIVTITREDLNHDVIVYQSTCALSL